MIGGVIALLFGSLGAAIPVGFALLTVGFIGLWFLDGWSNALNVLALRPFNTMLEFVFIAVPLFLLMARVIVATGIGAALYDTAALWLKRLPGGICVGSIVACTIFGAISGVPIAGTMSIGMVAIPEMRKRGYDVGLAVGAIGAGGALASLIPPSIPMVIYGLQTEQSVGRLLMAGFLPGLVLSAIFITFVVIRASLNPNIAPRITESVSFKERWIALRKTLPVLTLVVVILGGIYSGVATPTEAAGIGAFASILIGAIGLKGKLFRELWTATMETARMTAMVGFIMIGASVFSLYLTLQGLPETASQFITSLSVSPIVVMLAINVLYLFLGCFLDMISMMLITLPIIFPVITNLGFDPIWFGVVLMVNFEAAVLTPPFGFNLFVLQSLCPDVPYGKILTGVFPFIGLQVVGLAIIIAFPQISLVLPNMMAG